MAEIVVGTSDSNINGLVINGIHERGLVSVAETIASVGIDTSAFTEEDGSVAMVRRLAPRVQPGDSEWRSAVEAFMEDVTVFQAAIEPISFKSRLGDFTVRRVIPAIPSKSPSAAAHHPGRRLINPYERVTASEMASPEGRKKNQVSPREFSNILVLMSLREEL